MKCVPPRGIRVFVRQTAEALAFHHNRVLSGAGMYL